MSPATPSPRAPSSDFPHGPPLTPLILFDIDMTLVSTTGAGRLAMEQACERHFGIRDATEGMLFDGRTDRSIFLECLSRHSLPESQLSVLAEGYLAGLPTALAERGGSVLPGVEPLLAALLGRVPAIGLATGNLRRGAEAKLAHFGLWEHFKTGGFGDDHLTRPALVADGIRALAALLDLAPDPASAIVIGDTPLDIQAASAAGARSLGVATGRYPVDELLASGATCAVTDLSQTGDVLSLLLG